MTGQTNESASGPVRKATSAYIGERGPFPKTDRAAFLNYLRAKYEMYTGAERVDSYPYILTLEASDICQLRCATCVTGIENEHIRQKTGSGLSYRRNRAKLTPAFFDQLLEEMGEYLFLILFYNFGEPLLNPELPRLIRKAKAAGIETDINTNLSLRLSDEKIAELLESGIDYVFASIDGFSQEAYQVHRVGGDVELAKSNLARLARTRDRLGLDTTITYNMLVFSFNEHEVAAAEGFAADLGINFNTREAFVANADWLPSYRKDEQPRLVPSWLVRPRGFRGDLEIGAAVYADDEPIREWARMPPLDPTQPARCAWHYGHAAVTAGGSVMPCCGMTGDEHDLGQIEPGGRGFADVWNNQRYRNTRAAFAGKPVEDGVETVCMRCPLQPIMHHMYSLHDFKVIGQYLRVLQGTDPVLDQAFDLLSRARYGSPADSLIPPGRFGPPAQMLERQTEAETAAFVEFFARHLRAP